MLKTLTTTVVKGHQVASGRSKSSPYPAGSISLQKPFFDRSGINLQGMFDGTLNLSIAPHKFSIVSADHRIEHLHWIDGFPEESFSFVKCEVSAHNQNYEGWVYYPHPETKTQHFHNNQLLEVLCPFIPNLNYGDTVTLEYDDQKIAISIWC